VDIKNPGEYEVNHNPLYKDQLHRVMVFPKCLLNAIGRGIRFNPVRRR